MYIRLIEWIKKEFKEPRPSLNAIQRLCRENKLPDAEVKKIGKKWYVKVEEKNKGVNNEK